MRGVVELVCTPELAPGLALAGLKPREAADAAEAAERLLALSREPDVGLVLVEDRLYQGVSEETRKGLELRPLPLIVPFPGAGPGRSREAFEARIAELLRQAIGYRVRLR